MIVGCMMYVLKCINNLPAENGLSKEISPTTLVTGDPPPSFDELCKLKFGDYVQTALGRTRNNQTARTIGAVALYPSGNTSGGWYFMSLLTGQVVHRYSWTKLKVTEDVIQRVNGLGIEEGRGVIGTNFKYTYDRNGEDIQLEELVGDNPGNGLVLADINDEDREAMAELEEREEEINGREEMQIQERADENENREMDIENVDEQVIKDEEANRGEIVEYDENEGEENELIEEANEAETLENENTVQVDDSDEAPESEDESDMRTAGNMRLRPRRRLDYQALDTKGARQLAQKVKKIKKKLKRRYKLKVRDLFRKAMSITMSQIKAASKYEQVSVEEGLRRFGNKAVEAVLSEYSQLNDKQVFRTRLAKELTAKQKSEALNLITMIKQKRCGKIKGRACADGRKERRYITKEESSSPTIHLESLMLSLLFDAFEGRSVATADITGAYLLAKMKDFVMSVQSGVYKVRHLRKWEEGPVP